MSMADEERRSQMLDAWDYRAPFARFHISWGEGDVTPAFEQVQAYAIAVQESNLDRHVDLWAHREVLVTCASEHFSTDLPLPAWVVVAVGVKKAGAEFAPAIPEGAGVLVQMLIHARSGEVLLGTALPVRLHRE